MLIPGKLYRFDLGNTTCTFYTLNKNNIGYKRVGYKETITNQNTLHLFLGKYMVSYGVDVNINSLIFIVNDNKIIARSINDGEYMVEAC